MLNWRQQQGLLFNAHCIDSNGTRQNYSSDLRLDGDDGITKIGLKKRKTGKTHVEKLDDGDHEKKKKKAVPQEIEAIDVPELKTKGYELPAAQKTDYIHVRARRGQATDSHSLAERVRREKINEKMKHLQDLVPGCNNITGKASVLDEIINYVQSLQKQVEFLSMKLASVDPQIDCNMKSFIEKEISSPCSTSISRDKPSDLLIPPSLLFNPLQQATCSSDNEFGVTMNLLEHVISAPISVPHTFREPFFDVCGSSVWDSHMQEFHNVDFSQGREYSNPFHLFPAADDNNPM